MNFQFKNSKAGLSALLFVSFALGAAHPASATICYTSGKVYMQQKVYDKAAYFLECARKAEPDNVDALSLLAIARSEQHQYISAGAAFQLALDLAKKKNDLKKVQSIEQNRLSVSARLFNAGVKALAGTQGAEPPTEASLPAYTSPPDPQSAVTDTTVFQAFTGASRLEEAAYDFVLASYVDASSIETYQNLTYVLTGLGRTDDAILAAKTGLKVKPDDQRLHNNLRAAVMGKALKLYNDGKYAEAIVEFHHAQEQDPDPKAAAGYQLYIAQARLKRAEAQTKGSAEQKAAYDSAAVEFAAVQEMPAASDSIKENAMYNAMVIYANQENYPKAIAIFEKASPIYSNSREIWSLGGQIKFQKGDYPGAETALRHAVELDPEDPANHQFLFLTLNKLGKQGDAKTKESINEYTIYKALTQGSKKNAKVWVDSADNRLGASNQLKTVVKAEGYPDEVYTYSEEGKNFETFFFWTKGKTFTFLDGVMFSSGPVPPKKS
jgi:tetratricopeptide (TPR) repeat protein